MTRELPHADPDSQLARFRKAVDLIGGVRTAARELGVSDRTIYGLIYAKRDLHDGFLRDMAAALIRHADACRALERQLSPAFVANLTADQQTAKPHGNRYDRKSAVIEGDDRRAAGASATARPQAPGAQRRDSAEDKGADAPAKGENANG